jgi:hypothetical protein
MGLLVLVPLRTHDFTSGALCIAVIEFLPAMGFGWAWLTAARQRPGHN